MIMTSHFLLLLILLTGHSPQTGDTNGTHTIPGTLDGDTARETASVLSFLEYPDVRSSSALHG